jgi:hypothetical protein
MNTTFKNAFSTSLTGPALPLLSPAAKMGILRYKPGPGLPWQNVDHGKQVIPNWRVRYHGGIAWDDDKPVSILALDGEPSPAIPNDGRRWQSVVNIPVLVEDLGLAMLSTTSEINQRRISGLYLMWSRLPQAVAGQLQAYITKPFDKVSTAYGDYYAMVWAPTDTWYDYDTGTFGVPKLPPPVPIVRDNGTQSALPPAEPATPSAEPANAPQPVPMPPPANDALARFRPAGTGRQPY